MCQSLEHVLCAGMAMAWIDGAWFNGSFKGAFYMGPSELICNLLAKLVSWPLKYRFWLDSLLWMQTKPAHAASKL